jgi:tRNA/rRNA methyltransferase
MNNMGLVKLSLVNPKNCDLSRILKTATGPSIELIEQMEVHERLLEAVGPCNYVVGTTARTGTHRPTMTNPRRLACDLAELSQNNRIAVLFGPEDKGLSNEHLRHCDTIVTIPTASFSSLNLSQAVMLICYEIYLAGRNDAGPSAPRLANRFELEGMYDHLKDVLLKIGFIQPQNPEHWMLNIRRFLSRLTLRAREVRIIRGICRQIDWYTDQIEKLKKEKENDG